jgi:TFIIF-interacting CTD phosphatase-like protein
MLIMFRTDMRKMLRRLVKDFELILFTSSTSEYANAAIDYIEGREQFFQYRLTKDDCVPVPQFNFHVKDLRVLTFQQTRDLKDVIIIDNQLSNFMVHLSNGIPASEFNGDINDRELRVMCKYLLKFRDPLAVRDVRDKIKRDFDLQKYLYTNNNPRNASIYGAPNPF